MRSHARVCLFGISLLVRCCCLCCFKDDNLSTRNDDKIEIHEIWNRTHSLFFILLSVFGALESPFNCAMCCVSLCLFDGIYLLLLLIHCYYLVFDFSFCLIQLDSLRTKAIELTFVFFFLFFSQLDPVWFTFTRKQHNNIMQIEWELWLLTEWMWNWIKQSQRPTKYYNNTNYGKNKE